MNPIYQFNLDIIKSIQNMKCQAYECNNEAQPGFKGCNKQHGYFIRTMKEEIEKAQETGDWSNIDHNSTFEIVHYALL